jgi:AI-2 transport protein TqsA
MNDNAAIKNILIIFLIVLIFYLLSVLSSILIPLVLAFLFAILFQPLISYLSKKGVPKWLILPTVSIITLALVFLVGLIISDTATAIANEREYLGNKLVEKANSVLLWIKETFNLKFEDENITTQIENAIDTENISSAIGDIASGLGSFLGSFLFFALYYVMLLAGMSGYKKFVRYVGGQKSELALKEYENIQKSVSSYIWIKTVISIITGLLTFLFCIIFGIKFALFWGFIAFLLNFIPSIGSILGTILPILMGIIQLDSFQELFILATLLVAMQFTMGNVIEPIVMGSRMRLNTLTVLFGLVFWGYLWGIPGMILSVPLLVIMKLILERFPSFSFVGRLMGYPDK